MPLGSISHVTRKKTVSDALYKGLFTIVTTTTTTTKTNSMFFFIQRKTK